MINALSNFIVPFLSVQIVFSPSVEEVRGFVVSVPATLIATISCLKRLPERLKRDSKSSTLVGIRVVWGGYWPQGYVGNLPVYIHVHVRVVWFVEIHVGLFRKCAQRKPSKRQTAVLGSAVYA